ncbi:c-type cytochrome [Profundibacter sp.]|uniref:c-type cytochrome n=1 Tax=Profundibacter sp. TaxID=3101071 RepID=UPI003D146FF4
MNNNVRLGIAVLALAGFGALIYNNYKTPEQVAASVTGDEPAGRAIVQITVPELTGQAAIGKRAFEAKCATCHGENAVGQVGVAPPLIHQIYRPGHHGDMAFLMAARNGVRSHHWKFGNMPPVEGITDAEVKSIVAYVRALQQANGIN